MILESVQTEGIAELSYLVGDDKTGTAAVIDPRADVDIYVELARKRKVSITHVFETHIHADLVSGARELAERTQTASVFVSEAGEAHYGFAHQVVKDGDTYEFGDLVLTARHTPGHTPEHMSYEAAEKKRAPTPWGVFTGDSLFVNSAGRPDLMGSDQSEKLAEQLYDTLYSYYLRLNDDAIIYPAHGSGSPCGASIGDRLTSTIGYERKFNPYLQRPNRAQFKEFVLSTAPPEPTYYKRMKKLNAQGPVVIGNLPLVPGLPPEAFDAAVKTGDSRTGYTQFAGYLVGGMKAWNNAGLPLLDVPQMTVHELKARAAELQIVDVRSPDEWKEGHIPDAIHIFLPELEQRAVELKKEKPVAIYCDSGYRASLGTSILQQEGFDVHNVPGSWQAWKSAKYPVVK